MPTVLLYFPFSCKPQKSPRATSAVLCCQITLSSVASDGTASRRSFRWRRRSYCLLGLPPLHLLGPSPNRRCSDLPAWRYRFCSSWSRSWQASLRRHSHHYRPVPLRPACRLGSERSEPESTGTEG